jgi:hypothetical protein
LRFRGLDGLQDPTGIDDDDLREHLCGKPV